MKVKDDARNQLAIPEHSDGRELFDVRYWLEKGRLHNRSSLVCELDKGVTGRIGVSTK